MKKIIAIASVILTFLCDNEILTLFVIAIAALVVAIFLFKAWASKEKDNLPASFDVDWGKK